YVRACGDQNQGVRTTFQPGPVFAQMVLADEINRATPKTQSSLLEAMHEGTVTVIGVEYELPKPFFVLATQNPLETDGTDVRPEVPEPEPVLGPADVLALQRWTRDVPISSELRALVARTARSTQPELPDAVERVKRYVRYGVSPRGAQALVLAAKARALMNGRYNVSLEDVTAVALPALRHRLQANFEGEAAGVEVDDLIAAVIEAVAITRR